MTANLSLCSGAGTLDLAVEQITGNKTTVYAENDPFASRVMEARFPWATNVGDITTADWAAIAAQYQIESLTGGFSCQDISNAGKRAGIHGKRSSVWKNFAEAVRVIRPGLVFLENVEALRTKDRGLDVVLADLAALGYDARWTCLRASEVGAPHQRWRWFCIAYPADAYPVGTGWHGGAWDLAQAEGRHEPADRGLAVAAAGGAELALLPTPAARDWKSGASNLMGLRGEGRPLNEFVVNMLKGSLPDEQWISTAGVDYGPAIRSWEAILGRPAPAPVERGPRGGRALAARFTEWMQGNDEGWITDVDIPRNEQIKIAGNQAITRQAVEGYRRLLTADLDGLAGDGLIAGDLDLFVAGDV
ncbi:DNA cytosine methyltransferase, partial [Streptomyces lunaelactis]|uniref:DNA cytosine methyltransferase n=1 Tax=Streptomyces lunaelactis TaxID=1535768 RepID=UPI0028149B69